MNAKSEMNEKSGETNGKSAESEMNGRNGTSGMVVLRGLRMWSGLSVQS
jgi:hypothetical protein